MKKFRGTGVAMITPFKNDGSIDFKALEKVTMRIINGGAEYLVLLGTTSEAATMSSEERNAVVSYILELTNKSVPVVVGIGGNNTQSVVDTIKNTDFEGIDGILSVAPYYNKPGQKGLYLHFKAIANESPVPVIIYNVPGRTSSNISAETCTRLAWDFQNIVAVKEASGNMQQVMQIIRDTPDRFLVLSGDDMTALPIIASGGSGLISVLGNAFPGEWSEMVRLALKGNVRQAAEIHYKYLEMIGLIFEDGNPAGIKSVLNTLGICQNTVRLPLTSAGRTTSSKISTLIENLKLV